MDKLLTREQNDQEEDEFWKSNKYFKKDYLKDDKQSESEKSDFQAENLEISDSFDTDFSDKEEAETYNPQEKENLKRKRFVENDTKNKKKHIPNEIKKAKPIKEKTKKVKSSKPKYVLDQKKILEEAAMTELQNLDSLRV